jgi:hypothetical protein
MYNSHFSLVDASNNHEILLQHSTSNNHEILLQHKNLHTSLKTRKKLCHKNIIIIVIYPPIKKELSVGAIFHGYYLLSVGAIFHDF